LTEPERLREEAARCIRLTRKISNPSDAQTLLDMATSYLQRAIKLEAQREQPVPTQSSHQDAQVAQQQQQPKEPTGEREKAATTMTLSMFSAMLFKLSCGHVVVLGRLDKSDTWACEVYERATNLRDDSHRAQLEDARDIADQIDGKNRQRGKTVTRAD
jgi:hypothetical protein